MKNWKCTLAFKIHLVNSWYLAGFPSNRNATDMIQTAYICLFFVIHIRKLYRAHTLKVVSVCSPSARLFERAHGASSIRLLNPQHRSMSL
jgi:hypothetical protein